MNAMSLHQEAFNHIPVNFYPKLRAMRNLDCAVFNFNSFTNKCITEKIFREIVQQIDPMLSEDMTVNLKYL